MYKLMFAIGLIFVCQLCFAETCPSIDDIKKGTLIGWKIYDSDEDTPLTDRRLEQFKKEVKTFSLAEWADQEHKTGAIRCFYSDAEGSHMEAYLAKDKLTTAQNTNKKYWYSVSGSKHCAASAEKCTFETMAPKQLAKR